MKLEQIMLTARKVYDYFQGLQLSEKVVIWVVFLLVALPLVLSHTEFTAFIFVAALCGGGWAASLVTGHQDSVFNSRQLLPYLPDLVVRFKQKRSQAGLSALPNFGEDLGRYSINGHNFNKSRTIKKKQVEVDRETSAPFLKSKISNNGPISLNGHCLDVPLITLPVTVDEELQHVVKSIMHDFVLSWYSTHVSDHGQIPEEFLKHLLSISENLCIRLESISKRNLLTNYLVEFQTHVYRFQRARSSLRKLRSGRTIDSSSLVASYETFSLMHPAIEDTTTEMDYLKGVMRIILHSTVPRTVTRCQASTAILIEILTCNLLLPLLYLLTDPDFLYRLILLIISSAVSSSENIEAHGNKSADNINLMNPTSTSQTRRNVLQQENIDTSCLSHIDHSLACLPVNGGNDNQHSQTEQKPTSIHEIIAPRSEPKSSYQLHQSQSSPSLQQYKESPSFPLKSKDPNWSKVPTGASIPSSSAFPTSRSVDTSVIHLHQTIRHGNNLKLNESLLPGCSIATSSGGRRRSESDSSLNPAVGAFIPGDLNPVEGPSFTGNLNPAEKPSIPEDKNIYDGTVDRHSLPGVLIPNEGPSVVSCMPRPPTEGAAYTNDQLVIPLTTLEPMITTAPNSGRPDNCYDGRPRSWSGDSFSSINYDIGQMNMPFTDIDYQFAFEGNPIPHTAATKVVNSAVVRKPQIKQTNENERATDQRGNEENRVDKVSGLGTRGIEENKCVESDAHVHVVLQPECTLKHDSNQLQGTIGTTLVDGQRVITPVLNVAHSSSIKKFLRRVSFSKKSKHEAQTLESSATKNPPISVEMSRPVHSSDEQHKSPATLPQTTSTVDFIDDMRIPTATNPRILSVSASDTSLESESMLSFVDGLVMQRVVHLVISRAEVCKEMGGKGEFFLYSIQFDVLPTPSPSSSKESLNGCDLRPVHKMAKRRHREFVNLHSRLDHNPQLKHSLKGILDIPKRLSIPLAPTAKTAIDQRRISHQHYLQQLLARPLLHASAELAKFLAFEGDTHIEYVRHQPREYVPRIDKMLRNRVSDLVDTFKSAIPRALSDLGPLPPISPTWKSRASQDAGKKTHSPPGSPRPGSPSSVDEQDGTSDQERIFAFERRPKTTLQLAMGSIIQDHSCTTGTNSTLSINPTAATNSVNHYVLGLRSEGDGCESPDAAISETRPDGKETSSVLGSEEVALLDSVMCLLGEAFHNKEPWFLDEGFQSVMTILAGGLLDGWIERQVNLLLSEHWCAFYLAELREVLWPDGKLLSASEEGSTKSETEKEATRKEALTKLVDLMPESFYSVVNKQDWQNGLQLLLDSISDPQLNRHLVFTALDLLMDALIAEIKDEHYQKDLLSRI